MNFINSLGEKRIEKHFTFSSSQEIKKEINNILKIYLKCNQDLIDDIMKLTPCNENKFAIIPSFDSSPALNIKFTDDVLEDEVKSSKIFANEIFTFFSTAFTKEKNIIINSLKEFNSQTNNTFKKVDTEKFPNIERLDKLLEEYSSCKPRFQKPLLIDADIKIEIPDIKHLYYYQLNHEETKWLDGQVLRFPNKNEDYVIDAKYVLVRQDGSLFPQPSNSPKEEMIRSLQNIYGHDGSIREVFKNKKITALEADLTKIQNFCRMKFTETKQLRALQKGSLMFESFISLLTHQTEAIKHAYKLIQEYNDMLVLEKEVAKKIREEMRKTSFEQKIEIQFTPDEKEFSPIHKKKNKKEPQLSKKEQIILQNSKKSSEELELKPTLPVITTTDTSLIVTFQAIMKGKDSKITWKEAIDCCSKLGYAITPCGGSIYKFVYQNSLKALIPENELEKFVESIQEEKIEKTEEFKTSKNIHVPHREGQSHNEPLYPKLKNRFKLLFEETGFTLDHLKLEEKKEIKK